MKVVIVGGVAGGASTATRLRRMDEHAEIVLLERGAYISFANCGLPYYIGGVIPRRGSLLVTTPQALRANFNVDARINSEVLQIDRQAKTVTVHNLADKLHPGTGERYLESYDKLVLSPGASPFIPPVPGADLPGVFSLRNIPDMDRIVAYLDEVRPARAAVVGGGFIGIELAENLHRRGMQVTVVEMMNQVLAPLDFEMAAMVHQHMRFKQVRLALGDGLKAIERGRMPGGENGLSVMLQSGRRADAGIVILAIGVRPEYQLARDAGLTIGVRGTIATNEHLQTSDPDIYAIGDAAQVLHLVTGEPTSVPLAGPASKQGRLVADHIAGRAVRYKGVQGTAIVKVFDLSVATTGMNQRQLDGAGIHYQSAIVHVANHAGYYPGASPMAIKMLFGDEGQIYGAQIVGLDGVDKRLDVLATALRGGLTVYDLEELELGYAPPYGSTRDPVNIIGFVASNILRGDVDVITWDQVASLDRSQDVLLDVRNPPELEQGYIEGAINIPLPQLRDRVEELPRERRIVVYCQAGQRAYFACRMLNQRGFETVNLSGGYKTYSHAVGQQSSFDVFAGLSISSTEEIRAAPPASSGEGA
jgi:NADPH-dependent 2,4-dienoyl-CoA reductase/sulfur reductase-like enzyme/rhodanese-related sulfurtransferase